MNARILVPVLLAGILTSSCPASLRQEIEGQYKKWARAAMANDADTILSVLAPDYTLHTYTGTVISRSAYEQMLRKRKATNQAAIKYDTVMASVKMVGSQAQVISDETYTTPTVDPITNKKLKMIHVHRYLDTWVKIKSSWRLRTTITQVESTRVVPL